jgi:hypothetical protein
VTHHASIPLSLSLWVVLLVAFGSLACDEKLSDLAGPSPNLQPTFASVQHEIFEARDASGRAACTECHTDVGGRTPSGGLNLRHEVAYASLVGIASRNKAGAVRVIAGDADNSYIVHKLEGRPALSASGCRVPEVRTSPKAR